MARVAATVDGMDGQQPAELPIFPPMSFVRRYNEANPGQFRTALDPLLMLAWYMTTGVCDLQANDHRLLSMRWLPSTWHPRIRQRQAFNPRGQRLSLPGAWKRRPWHAPAPAAPGRASAQPNADTTTGTGS